VQAISSIIQRHLTRNAFLPHASISVIIVTSVLLLYLPAVPLSSVPAIPQVFWITIVSIFSDLLISVVTTALLFPSSVLVNYSTHFVSAQFFV
jgi:hypothetical protein